ncbi:glycosyltransferase [Cohnella suwonensis]|uniref:Glycosyltransferase n=1 Tax=Cohnella suwonensis TaxID=696072 RepID=A0ABW0LXV1_9BACL
MSKKMIVAVGLCAALLFGSPATAVGSAYAAPAIKKQACYTPARVQLQGDLRKLWIDHVVWTRNYIVSAVSGADDQAKVLERLLRNQQDIGNAIKPYYGDAAGDKLAELLTEHILLAGNIVDAAIKGNAADVDKNNKLWYANADEMARFLSKANPNWSEQELKKMLYEHLQLVTDALTTRLNKDWAGDIAAFDKGEQHMIRFADILVDGIVKQFPAKFK